MSEEKQNIAKGEISIDIKKVISNKNPELLKKIPKFIVKYLKRIIHQDELNIFLSQHGEKKGLEFVSATINYLGIDYSAEGLENIDPNGRYIFVANHPLGGLDGLIFTNEIGKLFSNIKFVVNDFLANISNMDNIFVPVNKVGKQSVSYARKIEEMFASDSQILYFPAGLCSRKIRGKITDLEWKKSFIQKAVKHGRDIIPVYFYGKNSPFFYNLAKVRAFFKIGVNIEMMYLPSEMFKQKGKKMKLVIGKKIPHTTFNKSKKPIEWAKDVKNLVYKLDQNPDIELQDII